MKNVISAVLAASVLAGCAQSASRIPAQYVSDIQYAPLDCNQIRGEMARVATRVNEISQKQDQSANADAISMTVGLVVFWPALFVLAATPDQKEELGRLKGEYQALQRAGQQKNCGIEPPAPPQKPPGGTGDAGYTPDV
ncbi:hypothetical protein ACKTEK_08915 [Tepidamorphus sp. 3E244]|uniref:hypothetical protein n=1 Tax=Tepidamorphus sp. 3E244 TaxID=3385498 RepID=UPI0038FD0562